LPEIFISPPSPSPAPEEGDNFRIIEEVLGPVENEEEVEGGGCSPRPELEIDEPITAPAPGPAQPQSDANSTSTGEFAFAPSVEEVTLALEDLKKILKPPQQTEKGYKDPELDLVFRARLEGMRQFMWTYINPNSRLAGCWTASPLHTADCLQRGPSHARSLQDWVRAFVSDHKDLPVNRMGHWNESVIDKDHKKSMRTFKKSENL
jgi:hypothetical protein